MNGNRSALIFLTLLSLALPSILLADWRAFVPQPFQNSAEIRGLGVYESDDNQIGPNRFRWYDRFFREKFTLFSNGYVYHPRFLLYDLSFSGILSQENYFTQSISSQGWRNRTGIEYNA